MDNTQIQWWRDYLFTSSTLLHLTQALSKFILDVENASYWKNISIWGAPLTHNGWSEATVLFAGLQTLCVFPNFFLSFCIYSQLKLKKPSKITKYVYYSVLFECVKLPIIQTASVKCPLGIQWDWKSFESICDLDNTRKVRCINQCSRLGLRCAHLLGMKWTEAVKHRDRFLLPQFQEWLLFARKSFLS